ncbi:angiotensin-converting enzyme-like [Uloborus diversus]|uniref:angiotensin-converting enzyme-like n=1 Tax=Uloborus diversus TaxID=327109 RepID=UPI0024097FFE|nr:angiotensin-converting enzyme-like [Uloborus diversus]XP_054707051.1 angiotensin-converting enzyme-like [Uloborus diversus]
MLFLTSLVLQMMCLIFSASVDNRVERYKSGAIRDKEAALKFLEVNDKRAAEMANKMAISTWKYQSNLTEANKQEMLEMLQEQAQFTKETWEKATSFAWKDFKESYATVYRWFKKLAVLGTAALSEEKLNELNKLSADMQDIYAKAKVCRPNVTDNAKCDLAIEPELTEMLMNSRDYDLLKHIWAGWRDATGKEMKDKFLRYVELSNEAAVLNGFEDAGEMWREAYESETFQDEVEDLWKTIEPFYKQLHAYVRRKLIRQYPGADIKPDGPIPAHLLGNMWAQTWGNIFDVVNPYPEKKFVDVTDVMLEKKMTPLDMFKMSEDFFTSLGLIEMTPEFWRRSIIEKPTDREMVCHASAWDFYDQKDFRIKMCTRVNMEDLITIHHEMGHIEYFQQYAKQPVVFRDGANPGFHEAVGDVLALSVATPNHLKKIGLLKEVFEDHEAEINNLLSMALDKIAFVPFGYLIDVWRWKVFSGEISEEELNSKWWDLRLKYQGLCPPVRRTDEDLDAASKYHVAADVPYIRYFVSYVIQFQFHKALCDAAGHEGPLHKCDIYQNKEAGTLLSSMLSLGNSVHWKAAMSVITEGKTDKMDAGPMLEYFRPLMEWLEEQNEGETIGWTSEDPMMCP